MFFLNNSATDSTGGGAIYCNGELTVKNSYFANNHAFKGRISSGNVANGGAITCEKASIENCTFIDNSAEGGGGAIRSRGGPLEVSNSVFISNSANYGGAIASTKSYVTSFIFIRNDAEEHGAISSPGGLISNFFTNITDSVFLANGGEYIIDCYDYYISNCWFGNTADNMGRFQG